MPKVQEVPERGEEDLGLDWDKWTDGRAFRLKRKRDFPADLRSRPRPRTAARYAAEKRGKVVRTIRDRYFPKKYIWVQFADDEVEIGEPCPVWQPAAAPAARALRPLPAVQPRS